MSDGIMVPLISWKFFRVGGSLGVYGTMEWCVVLSIMRILMACLHLYIFSQRWQPNPIVGQA